jgi:hypothetical protein
LGRHGRRHRHRDPDPRSLVLPGFITLTLRERLYIVRGEDTPFERLLSALFYSAIVYGTLLATAHWAGLQKSDLISFQAGEKSLGAYLLAASAILVLLPSLIAITGSHWTASRNVRPRILRLIGSSKKHATTSAWNGVFAELSPCLVRVTLSDGRLLGGRYDEGCIAGYSEKVPDLYLSQRWDLDDDGWFTAPARQSLGLWLSNESIVSLEFYDISDTRYERKP